MLLIIKDNQIIVVFRKIQMLHLIFRCKQGRDNNRQDNYL